MLKMTNAARASMDRHLCPFPAATIRVVFARFHHHFFNGRCNVQAQAFCFCFVQQCSQVVARFERYTLDQQKRFEKIFQRQEGGLVGWPLRHALEAAVEHFAGLQIFLAEPGEVLCRVKCSQM